MTRFFSPSTGAFYAEAVHGARMVKAPLTQAQVDGGRKARRVPNPDTLIPDDAVPVDDGAYHALMQAQAEGQRIIVRGGKPVAVDPLPPEPVAQMNILRAKRNRLLAATDHMVSVPDYPITAEQRDELLIWRADLRAMMRTVDPAHPFDSVVWPERPDWLDAHGVTA